MTTSQSDSGLSIEATLAAAIDRGLLTESAAVQLIGELAELANEVNDLRERYAIPNPGDDEQDIRITLAEFLPSDYNTLMNLSAAVALRYLNMRSIALILEQRNRKE